MEITFTKDELSKYISDISDWYNEFVIFVMAEGFKRVDPMTQRIRNPTETFHQLAKQYQEEHPKPDWRQLL